MVLGIGCWVSEITNFELRITNAVPNFLNFQNLDSPIDRFTDSPKIISCRKKQMSTIEIQSLFAEHGIKDTGNRLLIARALHESGQPLSLLELEAILGTIDKSTILRTLNLFREAHLVHVIESGDGCTRYEICQSHHHDEDEDAHLHFFCELCHQTICLSDKHIPQIELPDGYVAHSANFLVKGLCPKCGKKLGV